MGKTESIFADAPPSSIFSIASKNFGAIKDAVETERHVGPNFPLRSIGFHFGEPLCGFSNDARRDWAPQTVLESVGRDPTSLASHR